MGQLTEYKIELIQRLKELQRLYWRVKIISNKDMFVGWDLENIEFAIDAFDEILAGNTDWRENVFSIIDISERRVIHHISNSQCLRYLKRLDKKEV